MCMAGDSSCSFGMTENEIPRRACAFARNDKIRNDTGRKSIKSKRGAEIRTSLYRTPTPPLADSECKESMCHSEGYNPTNLYSVMQPPTEQCHSEVRSTEESPVKRIFLMIFLADASE